MANGIAGYAYADCRMLGRDAGPFLPVFSYLYDSHARTQYSFALVVHLWRTPCPFPGAAHLCNAAARGGWFSTMGRSHSVFDLCARTAMVRELLASHQALCSDCSAGWRRAIRAGHRIRVAARKCARLVMERLDCGAAERLSRDAYLRYELDNATQSTSLV